MTKWVCLQEDAATPLPKAWPLAKTLCWHGPVSLWMAIRVGRCKGCFNQGHLMGLFSFLVYFHGQILQLLHSQPIPGGLACHRACWGGSESWLPPSVGACSLQPCVSRGSAPAPAFLIISPCCWAWPRWMLQHLQLWGEQVISAHWWCYQPRQV